jgi:DNA-binding response OmpR family regulator
MMAVLCKLLLIEDDLPLASLISQYLRANQCDIVHVSTGEEINLLVNIEQFDMVLCDVMLPDISGFELFANLQKKVSCPIIFLTALDEDKDQIYGLNLGAVDYIIKPVEPAVLLARIKSHLRHVKLSAEPFKLQCNELILDIKLKTIRFRKQVLPVTVQEFELLNILAQSHMDIVPREVLFKQVIGREYDGLDRSIDLIVSRLRKKFVDLHIQDLNIRSIRGKGYLFSVAD